MFQVYPVYKTQKKKQETHHSAVFYCFLRVLMSGKKNMFSVCTAGQIEYAEHAGKKKKTLAAKKLRKKRSSTWIKSNFKMSCWV